MRGEAGTGLARRGSESRGVARHGTAGAVKQPTMGENAMTARRMAIAARLKSLEVSGRLTAEHVVEDARAEDSPLHGFFEWDDGIAAAAYRLDQARALIVTVKLEVVTEMREIRAPYYVRDPEASGDQQGYTSVVSIRSDRDRSMSVLRRELGCVRAALERAQAVAAAVGLSAELERMLSDTDELVARVDAAPVAAEPAQEQPQA